MGPDYPAERVYKTLWHLAIAGIGIWEYRNQKSKFSRFLSVGLIAFHLDGAIADALDQKPLSRRILERATGAGNESNVRLPRQSKLR